MRFGWRFWIDCLRFYFTAIRLICLLLVAEFQAIPGPWFWEFSDSPGRDYIPPPPPISGQKAFFRGGGWGCILRGPTRQEFYRYPPFVRPPRRKGIFRGGGWGCIKFGPVDSRFATLCYDRTPQSAHRPHKSHKTHRQCNPGGSVHVAVLLGSDNSYTTPSKTLLLDRISFVVVVYGWRSPTLLLTYSLMFSGFGPFRTSLAS